MVVSQEEFYNQVARFSKNGEYGFDVETTGLMWDDRLFSIILADADGSAYFNFNEEDPRFPNLILPRELIKEMQPIFGNPNTTLFAHNAKFDWRMVEKEGIDIKAKVVCSMATERVIKNNYAEYDLDACTQRRGWNKSNVVQEYVDRFGLKEKRQIPGKKKTVEVPHYWKVPLEIIAEYGEKDGKLHRDLGLIQREQLIERSRIFGPTTTMVTPLVLAENESRLTRTCHRIEARGVSLDIPYTKQALAEETALISHWENEFKELVGLEFNDGRTTLVRAFEQLKLEYPKTDKGNPSFSEESLEHATGPIAEIIRNIRKYEKRVSTYYSSFLYHLGADGKIHANIRQAGTTTGRFSYSDPNLQNVPKEEDEDGERFRVRGCFKPSPGKCFVSLDYRQQEYRMLLDYAGEAAAIKAINEGEDPHDVTARLTGLKRSDAKNVVFALIYGAGDEKLALMMKRTEKEAAELRATLLGKLPGVRKFIRDVQRAAKQRGYIRNWFGRVCYFDDPNNCYKAVNYLIQGGCAEVVKLAMNRLDEIEAPMVTQIHDELLLEMTPDQFDQIPKYMEIMGDSYTPMNGMRLNTSCSHSWKSWSYLDMVKGLPDGNRS